MSAKHWSLRVFFSDGTAWDVPVEVIARSRAANYADEYGGDIERSLTEDTWPLFEDNDDEVTEWAVNNMNWSDVEHAAAKVDLPPKRCSYEMEWGTNARKKVVIPKVNPSEPPNS